MATTHDSPQTSDEIMQLLQQAEAGDESVVEQVRELLMICPELTDYLGGDLEKLTEQLLSTAVAGDNLAFREAIKHKMGALKLDLAGPVPTPLESLLVNRIVACWLQVQTADIAPAKSESTPISLAKFHLKRQDSANRRYIAAIRTLATVRKMALPALQINLRQNNQINMTNSVEA